MSGSSGKHPGFTEFEKKKARLVRRFREIRDRRSGSAIELAKKTDTHLYRPRRRNSNRLNMKGFNRVILVDPERRIAEVEGMTTTYDVAAEALKAGCLPKVAPEMRTITVGGGVAGVAVESSSFRYGLLHETVTELEVLTGTGEVICCTPHNEHRDLFFGLPNSYGTFGYILRAQVELVPAAPFVRLTHRHFDDLDRFFREIERVCELEQAPAFLDGAIFSDDLMVMTTGEFVDEAPYRSNYRRDGIYHRSMRERESDFLTTHDYIWRWDADSFWSTRNTALEARWFRRLFGEWILRSDYLYKAGQLRRRILAPLKRLRGVVEERIVQDVGVRVDRCADFVRWFRQAVGVYPLWVCPIRCVRPGSSYPLIAFPEGFHCDIGFYSSVRHTDPSLQVGHFNRLIEQKVDELRGLKALYSASFYPREEFWRIYNGAEYQRLKAKYDPDGAFPDLFEKAVCNR